MITWREMMRHCTLCPRACGAERLTGQRGVCGQTAEVKVARAALHMWEEPCISGTRGSGTVFFSGCPLHCVFCQNHNIASGAAGRVISIERLGEIFLELQGKGANNINLVTAEHFVPQVAEALRQAKGQGLHIPVVYNSGGYETVETLRMLEGYVDVYLPDFKYWDASLSEKYSHAPDYRERAMEALAEMVRQTGTMEFAAEAAGETAYDRITAEGLTVAEYQERSEQGEVLLMTRGVIVRHLLLPGCGEDSRSILAYLLDTYGERIFLSIMNQYTPLPHAAAFPELTRRVTPEEYEALIVYALELGLENGFIQEGDTAQESFIPEFDGEGVLE